MNPKLISTMKIWMALGCLFASAAAQSASPAPPYITPTVFTIECEVARGQQGPYTNNDSTYSSAKTKVRFTRANLDSYWGTLSFKTSEATRWIYGYQRPRGTRISPLDNLELRLQFRPPQDNGIESFSLFIEYKIAGSTVSTWGQPMSFLVGVEAIVWSSMRVEGANTDSFTVTCKRLN